MRKKLHDWIKTNYYDIISYAVLALLLICAVSIIIVIFKTDACVDSKSVLSLGDYISFYGTVLGAVIGASITVFSFIKTIKQNDKNNRITREQLDEQARLAVLPAISVEMQTAPSNDKTLCLSSDGFVEGNDIYSDNCKVAFTNLGSASAFGVCLIAGAEKLLGDISVCDKKIVLFQLPEIAHGDIEVALSIHFCDVQARKYKQCFTLIRSGTVHMIKDVMLPEPQ